MIETYDALCLKEPWLELILLGIKTLESRTKCLRKTAGEVVLVSSLQVDEHALNDPYVGGRLDAAARERAFGGLGRLAGLVNMSGFRPGVPGVDDAAALIAMVIPNRPSPRPEGFTRFVSACSNPRRLVRHPTQRVRPDGSITSGASQGFFRVPQSLVEVHS